MKNFALALFCFSSFLCFSQQPASDASMVEKGLSKKAIMTNNSLVKNLPFKNIGPAIMSGRVVGFAVNPVNPTEFYVGYASGGVWHTTNNGTTFTPVFDSSPTQNVGCLAMDWKTKTLWVGTGEVNSSRSSYAGIGLLKSNDNGANWENVGLKDSHHISNILINPVNSDEIVVGVVGHLYSKNAERGIFKTMDGGKTWSKTLFINDQSGVIELVSDPNNFSLMYASSWDKDRKAWNFKGDGPGSGIYKSIDAGSTWANVSAKGSGFPVGEGVGRIGLAIYDEKTVYAIVDNQNRREDEKSDSDGDGLKKDRFKTMTNSEFLALDDNILGAFLKSNNFKEKYSAEYVKEMVGAGTANPIDLATYLEDANSLLFDTPVVGAEVYRTTDGGKTWTKRHEGYLDDIYYSYGYYFGKVHVAPQDKNAIYIYGVPILKSKDGGKSFTSIGAENVHSDHHALWINPNLPGHLINGNDGGVNISYDDGENWIKNNAPSVGQFYAINVDNEKPYNVYGGLQDNGVWVGPHTTEENKGWHQRGKYPYDFIMGGDGMQVEIDNRNSAVVYTGYQFGNYYRLNRKTDESTYIQPKHELGENPYRFNWQTPILLSSHNQDILYLGGNKLMRSMDQGDHWEAISADVTAGGKAGNVAYGTLTSISESKFQFGLLYTGSDDGVVQVSKNGGDQWTNISLGLPEDLWVSRVVASAHKKERVYSTLNGYRWDDFTPYVYVSENYGATWKSIGGELPSSSINVIKEDPANENVLYLGADNGAYVSLNRGESWEAFSNGLPNVAVHDLVIQAEAKDIVLGTHGRSLYVADVALIQKLTAAGMNEVVIADLKDIRHSKRWGSSWNQWGEVNEPSVAIQFYCPQGGKTSISVESKDGEEVQLIKLESVNGINIYEYDLAVSKKGVENLETPDVKLVKGANDKYYLPKGKYTVTIKNSSKSAKTVITIK
ncbi:glycosyl hydrolase [Ulvibacter sp.]|nr:glycosyl hydrolase [Ulvibacter sp.]MDC1327289.1 glycosyl hydrolase [Ulvibacter sp.]